MGGFGTLNAIQQGTAGNQRTGRRVWLQHFHMKGNLELHAVNSVSTPQQAVACRVVILWNKAVNGTVIDPDEVFAPAGLGGQINGLRNLDYLDKYEIMYDERFTLAAPSAAPTGALGLADYTGQKKFFEMELDLDIPVTFTDVSGTIDEVTDNAVQLLCWADRGGVCNINYVSRTTFVG